jgi:hypothetical protein
MKRVFIYLSALIWAQATAQISGSVRDQTGAVLPGVEVTVSQTATGLVRSSVSNETGVYTLPNLPTGPYRLEASLPGFRTYVQTGIVLEVNGSPVINVRLEVGQVAETVEVQANATLVETRNVGVGQIMENQRILELPLNGRNVNDLITLSGGAVQTGVTGSKSFAGSPQVAVAGSMQTAAGYLLDGATHNSVFDGYSLPMPFPDALQEFKVETSGLSAQTAKGTSVGAVTKAGTNDLHGSLFEFARNDLFNATNYFAAVNPQTGRKVRSTLKRHQMGGTLGGPIAQNKLFFFGGYQRTTVRQDPADVRRYVPTAAMLAGDWSAFASPACNAGRQINLTSPFVNNRVDPALYSKAALNIASKLPKPIDPCGLVTFGPKTNENAIQVVGKVDYQRSANHSMFGRFLANTSLIPHPYTFDESNPLLSIFEGYDNLVQSYALGDTYLISPTTVNAFRLTVNRMATHRISAKYFGPQDVGINAYSYLPKFLNLNVNGAFALGGGTKTDSTTRGTSYHMADDVNATRGNHQMAFGGNLAHGRSNTNSNSQSPGGYTFNGRAVGLGMGDFLLGKLTTLSQGGPSQLYQREWFAGLYASDSWRATPKLTINTGVRWEPYLPTVDSKKAVYNFDYDRFRQGIKSTVFKFAPAGFYYPGDPGFPNNAGINSQWHNFAPRLGLAWDPQGNGRMSIRASYAFSYEYYPLRFREDVTAASPWGKRNTQTSPVGGLDDPWRGVPGGSPFPFLLNADAEFAPHGVFETTRYDIHNPYASLWNLSIQREVAKDLLVSASYLGTQTVHIWTTRGINPAIFFPGSAVNGACTAGGYVFRTTGTCSTAGNIDDRRKLSLENPAAGQYIGALDDFDDGGTQSYNGLLLSVQRRAAKGITINSNYTWSHCIGDHYETDGPAPGDGYTDVYNRDFDRGNCESDRRHIFNFTAVTETPTFSNSSLRTVASGWRLSGIYRVSSGRPLSILAGDDRALIGINSQRADLVMSSPYGDKAARPLTNFLNRAAFSSPALGTLGNMGPLNVRGVSSWQFDMSLSRAFRFKESRQVEFRAEAYNVTNSFRPIDPNTSLTNSQFGQIRDSLPPRIMQFALKYMF